MTDPPSTCRLQGRPRRCRRVVVQRPGTVWHGEWGKHHGIAYDSSRHLSVRAQGLIVESRNHDPRSDWYLATLRQLSHNGFYDGLDSLFAETTPACPLCAIAWTSAHEPS